MEIPQRILNLPTQRTTTSLEPTPTRIHADVTSSFVQVSLRSVPRMLKIKHGTTAQGVMVTMTPMTSARTTNRRPPKAISPSKTQPLQPSLTRMLPRWQTNLLPTNPKTPQRRYSLPCLHVAGQDLGQNLSLQRSNLGARHLPARLHREDPRESHPTVSTPPAARIRADYGPHDIPSRYKGYALGPQGTHRDMSRLPGR